AVLKKSTRSLKSGEISLKRRAGYHNAVLAATNKSSLCSGVGHNPFNLALKMPLRKSPRSREENLA
ncbi:MAG: hypothetical protein MHMPM18_003546, partial [Marteilia pararefringens]